MTWVTIFAPHCCAVSSSCSAMIEEQWEGLGAKSKSPRNVSLCAGGEEGTHSAV